MCYVYVLCTPTNNNNTGPGGTGGSAKLKSSKGDNTLRDGRKGDPLHECCGKYMIYALSRADAPPLLSVKTRLGSIAHNIYKYINIYRLQN